ncbi:HNH endonuclease signature motif containing protein [Aquimarina sp. 2201CG14-23]|uniref:HNH endonuclease signature motif containing protein n=1 Tax=Aquimarina mycalae TaxID=3040073 RepID=UPI002477CE18|nr:HNH endonuclease [Aquimarina sp. 2201CG14-23]MDH7447687.1 HNH endonuclease [Aquimarina sp. 2201CG14-23]
MRKWFNKLLKFWEVKQEFTRIRFNLTQNPYLRIIYKKDTSITLGCFGIILNGKGKKVLNWKGVTVFTEKRGSTIKGFLKQIYESTTRKGRSLEEFMDELIFTFKLSGKTIKFDKKIIQLLAGRNLKIVKGKGTKKYLDIVDQKGDLRFRGAPDEIEKYAKKISKSNNEVLKDLDAIVTKSLKSKQKYDPLKEALFKRGIKIKSSVRGLVPDFRSKVKYLYKGKSKYGNIKIKLTGVDAQDFKAANKIANLKKTPAKYTWHHLDDYDPITGECTMQLVETKVHRWSCPHKGGAGLWSDLFKITYKDRK